MCDQCTFLESLDPGVPHAVEVADSFSYLHVMKTRTRSLSKTFTRTARGSEFSNCAGLDIVTRYLFDQGRDKMAIVEIHPVKSSSFFGPIRHATPTLRVSRSCPDSRKDLENSLQTVK